MYWNKSAVSYGFLLCFAICQILSFVSGHGRLMIPPSRNAMWRFGFPNPVDYNDNELYCGGFTVQWDLNKGNCGICGDDYRKEPPRPHEAGGKFANGIITRHYAVGQVIDIEVELTANHYGRFELYLCPNNNYKQEATPECFDRYPLYLRGTKEVAYHIPEDGLKKADFKYQVQLPPYVTCTQCVLRWIYYTGNQWGMCANGTTAVGCGASETFVNCADIAILGNVGGILPPPFIQDNPFLLYYIDMGKSGPSYNLYPLVIREQICEPTGKFRMLPGLMDWCQTNCLRYPPNCPSSLCQCPTTCDAIGRLSGVNGASVDCMDKCLTYSNRGKCPKDECSCYEEEKAIDVLKKNEIR